MKNNCTIVVSSFDGFSDVWKPFFTLFFRYWPDCPYDIYLITNHKQYLDKRVVSLQLGDDKGWSTNLINTLERINSEYIIYFQEDYFLNGKVENEDISNLINVIKKENAAYLRFSPHKQPMPYKDYSDIKIIPKNAPYLNSTQAAIWNKDVLLSILEEGESGWDFEKEGGVDRARKIGLPFLCSRKTSVPYLATAIVKGRFVPGAITLCKKEGVSLDSSRKVESKVHFYLRKNPLLHSLYAKSKKLLDKIF